jgi:hypothetical protein
MDPTIRATHPAFLRSVTEAAPISTTPVLGRLIGRNRAKTAIPALQSLALVNNYAQERVPN